MGAIIKGDFFLYKRPKLHAEVIHKRIYLFFLSEAGNSPREFSLFIGKETQDTFRSCWGGFEEGLTPKILA